MKKMPLPMKGGKHCDSAEEEDEKDPKLSRKKKLNAAFLKRFAKKEEAE